ncbi:hypothetical protein CONPUDRAFT_140754 [Coniophora puteana RWD-64-598 SS2]|uniref:Uncharacterized protein n=1 Tax=Coniophora puteana (strain RWD-64-598) TaxID=741705 RepID=A0A5M3N3P2_CONPW|nr:uncharacterized protein CONPUDRAFT_140754 [Coniophora puteana RWD-64-598 SS2]EIW85966.1 hypothetical protein CONPUDRAFT_140754 [Coniophora puteana RWD-64-598 SS2]
MSYIGPHDLARSLTFPPVRKNLLIRCLSSLSPRFLLFAFASWVLAIHPLLFFCSTRTFFATFTYLPSPPANHFLGSPSSLTVPLRHSLPTNMPFSFARIFRASKPRKFSTKDDHPSTTPHGSEAVITITRPSASSSCVDLPATAEAPHCRRPHTLTIHNSRSNPSMNQAYLNPPPYSALSTIHSATGTVYGTPPTSPESSPHDQVMVIGPDQLSVRFPPTPGFDSDVETLAEEGASTSKLDLGQGAEEEEEEHPEEPVLQSQLQATASERPSPPTRPRQISFSPPHSRSASPAQDIPALPEPRHDRPATTHIVPRGILKNSPSRGALGFATSSGSTTIPAAPTPMSETFSLAHGLSTSAPAPTSTSTPKPQRKSVPAQPKPQQLPIGPTPTQDEIDAAQSQRRRKAMSMFQFQRKMSQRDLPQPPTFTSASTSAGAGAGAGASRPLPQPPRVPGVVARHFSVPPLAPTYPGEGDPLGTGTSSRRNSRRNSRRTSNRHSGGGNANANANASANAASSSNAAGAPADEALPTYRQSMEAANPPSRRTSKRGSRTSRWNTDWNSDETQAVLTALRGLN